jgi:hypothetical protein
VYSPTNHQPVSAGAILARWCRMAPALHRQSNRIEILLGRSAALCLHPLAAWRSRAKADRVMLLVSYVAISYVVVFGLLHVISA